MVRKDTADLVYKNERGKFRAVVEEIEDCHERGQPVLVGTVSVEKSEVVATMLRKKGIPHNVLNAKQHEREADDRRAGRPQGRGHHRDQHGRPRHRHLARRQPRGHGARRGRAATKRRRARRRAAADETQRPSTRPRWRSSRRSATPRRRRCSRAGGLQILGTERHESRRIDNQLRGRAGRQGDPGSSRFYLSLQDDLLRIFGAERITGLMERLGLEEDVPIEHGLVTRAIENAQKKVEGHNFDIRKNLLEYDDVMNQQRKTIYALRRQILEGRYHPEPTEEDKKKGEDRRRRRRADRVGQWTHGRRRAGDVARPMLDAHVRRAHRGDARRPRARPHATTRQRCALDPARLRAEIWRQFGAWLDLEKRTTRTHGVARPAGRRSRRVADPAARAPLDLCRGDSAAIVRARARRTSTPRSGTGTRSTRRSRSVQLPSSSSTSGKTARAEALAESLWPEVETDDRRARDGAPAPRLLYFARHFYLEEIDKQWIEHLKTMDALREGIGLRGYGQKDPKKEYKKAGFAMFPEMMERIGENVIKKLFHVQIQRSEAKRRRQQRRRSGASAARSSRAAAPSRARPAATASAAKTASLCAGISQGRSQRSVPLRQREKIQEMPRRRRATV